jgi:hypothetical protein
VQVNVLPSAGLTYKLNKRQFRVSHYEGPKKVYFYFYCIILKPLIALWEITQLKRVPLLVIASSDISFSFHVRQWS